MDDWIATKLASDERGRHLFAFVERGGWYWRRGLPGVAAAEALHGAQYNGKPRQFADMTLAQFREATGRD